MIVALEPDVAEVGAREKLRVGIPEHALAFLDDADEGFPVVGFPVDAPEVSFGQAVVHESMGRHEDAAHQLDGRRREMDLRRPPTEGEFLHDLRRVAMARGLEGTHGPAAVRVVGGPVGLVARRGGTDLPLHEQPGGVDGAGLHEGRQRQDRRGGQAPGARDAFGVPDLVPVEFGQAVHEPAEDIGMGMGMSVPGRIVRRIAQPEVRAQVDDAGRQAGKGVPPFHRLPVGQAQAKDVAGIEVGHGAELEVRDPPQVRVGPADGLAGERFRRHLCDFDFRVEQEQAEQFPSAVSGRAGDRHLDHDWATFTR